MIRKIIDKVTLVLLATVMLALVIGAVWQVFTRFVLRDPSMWTDEALRFLLIWATMLGAAFAFGNNLHLSLGLVRDKLKGPVRTAVLIFNEITILIFAISFLILGGLDLSAQTMGQLTAVLRLPMGVVYSVLPISGVIIVLVKLLNYINIILHKRTKGPEGEAIWSGVKD